MKLTHKKSGFTLIELLVVIAIIAILAAILFPVFAKAREKARQTTCASNERQQGLGLLQYVQDFDETFPLTQSYGNGGFFVLWQNSIDPYIKAGTASGAGGISGGIDDCPDFTVPQYGSSYAINESLAPVDFGSPGTPLMSGPVATLAAIPAPTETVLVAEIGANDASAEYGFFDPQEINWADTMGTSAGNYLNYQHWDLLLNNPNGGGQQNGNGDTVVGSSGDCDASPADIVAGNAAGMGGAYDGCSMMPRYRHTQTSNFLFSDGHVKAIVRGQLSWYRNVYVQGAYEKMGYGSPY